MLNVIKPFSIKNVEIKNRLVMGPMCMYSAENDGLATPFHRVHYATRAYGGVGLITVEATAVTPSGRISENDLGLWNNPQINNLKEIVDLIHNAGSKAALQLAHAGRKAEVSGEIFAPSGLRFSNDYKIPHEMSIDEIRSTVLSFKEAAVRAIIAGFDILEIHAAHGYLLNQFLSPYTNKRKDLYGAMTYESRFKIVKEIIETIRDVNKNIPLSMRFSATDYVDNGNILEDIVVFSKMAQESGIDIISISSGGISEKAPENIYPGYQVTYAQKIKKAVNIPTIAVGLITRIEQIEQILGNEEADFIAMGRELLRNPYFLLNVIRTYSKDLAKLYYPKQYLGSI